LCSAQPDAGINAPISVAPSNFGFFRQASVELYK